MRKTLDGSTIVEVVTGVMLIALGIALSIVVYTRIMENSNLYVRHQAVTAVDELIVQQTKAMNYRSVEMDTATIRISSVLVPFPGNDHLQVITYSAIVISSSETIYQRKIIKRIEQCG